MYSKEFIEAFYRSADALKELSIQWDRLSMEDLNKFEGAISATNPDNRHTFTYPTYLPSFDEFAADWHSMVMSVAHKLGFEGIGGDQ